MMGGEEAVEESFDDDGPRRTKMDRDRGIAVMDLRTKKRIRNGASSFEEEQRSRHRTRTKNKEVDIEREQRTKKSTSNEDKEQRHRHRGRNKTSTSNEDKERRHQQRTKTKTSNFQLNKNEARFIDFDTSTTSSRGLKWDFFLSHRCDSPNQTFSSVDGEKL